MLEVRVLGQFDVRLDGDPIEIPSRPSQSLLAYLLLHGGKAHRREMLAGMFWPEASESNARGYLRHALWRLRKTLGAQYLLADKISISFDSEQPHWLDAMSLQQPLDDGVSSASLEERVAVYGGELLPGFYEDWVVLERERMRALFEQRIQFLLDRLIEEQHWQQALVWGERWISMGEVPEPAYRAIMLANFALGDKAGMAAAYQRCCAALQEELGLSPSEETRQTYEQLREGRADVIAMRERFLPQQPEGAQAIRALLQRWRMEEKDTLDLSSLAIVRAFPGPLSLDRKESMLLVRSALLHGLGLEPWLQKCSPPAATISALEDTFASYPKPQVRMQIVEALQILEDEPALALLQRIALEDDAPRVRAAAAVAAADAGYRDPIARSLVDQVHQANGAAAMQALVELADRFGLPQDLEGVPRFSLNLALAQRRWTAQRPAILSQMGRAALGGALAMGLVATLQLIPTALLSPEAYAETVEFIVLPIWIVSNALMGFLWGGLQGAATGFLLGLGDALAGQSQKVLQRMLWAACSGLVHAGFLIGLSLIGAFSPPNPPLVYIPLYLLYGLVTGAAFSLIIPPLDTRWSWGKQAGRVGLATLIIAVIASASVYLIYGERTGPAVILDLLFAFLYPWGLTLAVRRRAAALTKRQLV